MGCFVFSTHGPLVDFWGESSFNSIKTGTLVTPDPIKLLAGVHDHDVNDNATEDNCRNRQKNDTLQSGRQWWQFNSTEMTLKNSDTINMSISHCGMIARCLETAVMICQLIEGKGEANTSLPQCCTAPSGWWRRDWRELGDADNYIWM